MTIYRDKYNELNGHEIASVVGCGLDRVTVERPVSSSDENEALRFYGTYKDKISNLENIGAQRDCMASFVLGGYKVPHYI